MKTILQQIAEKTRKQEKEEREAIKAEIANPATTNDRRNFLKKAAFGGIALGGLMHLSIEDTIAHTTQKVSRASSPSDLKITDLRVANKQAAGGRNRFGSIIRIDTNQGIYGIGSGTMMQYALELKSKIIGLNPCNVEMIFKVINQYGFHGRRGGGVSAVEMACWDLCGKAYGVPVWQMLGGRYRDKIRFYADTPDVGNEEKQKELLKHRIEVQGATWLKMDMELGVLNSTTPGGGLMVNNNFWGQGQPNQYNPEVGNTAASRPNMQNSMELYMHYWWTEHPFTQIQITEKGLEAMAKLVENVRNVVGIEVPLCSDHYGYMDENQFIRLGRAVEKYRMAWLEDAVPWFYTDKLKAIKEAIETPILTGEDTYMLGGMFGGFKPMIDAQAVDIIHPDLVMAGGILETKRIGDYAEEAGIPMAMHANSDPIAWMANVHCAAATQNFLCLEHHNLDRPEWENMVIKTDGQPLITKGFGNVPLTAPGLGIELNEEYLKSQMPKGAKLFEPTTEWDNYPSWNRTWI